jgi:hypothetical protein
MLAEQVVAAGVKSVQKVGRAAIGQPNFCAVNGLGKSTCAIQAAVAAFPENSNSLAGCLLQRQSRLIRVGRGTPLQ